MLSPWLQMDKQMSTENQVNQMFEIAFSNTIDDAEKREQVSSPLLILDLSLPTQSFMLLLHN